MQLNRYAEIVNCTLVGSRNSMPWEVTNCTVSCKLFYSAHNQLVHLTHSTGFILWHLLATTLWDMCWGSCQGVSRPKKTWLMSTAVCHSLPGITDPRGYYCWCSLEEPLCWGPLFSPWYWSYTAAFICPFLISDLLGFCAKHRSAGLEARVS